MVFPRQGKRYQSLLKIGKNEFLLVFPLEKGDMLKKTLKIFNFSLFSSIQCSNNLQYSGYVNEPSTSPVE
jgi:hypothetical protein